MPNEPIPALFIVHRPGDVLEPIPVKFTSTQEWASKSRTTYSPVLRSTAPLEKPVLTRAGMPARRVRKASRTQRR